MTRLNVVSDIHYAGALEQRRRGYESAAISNPILRGVARLYRRWIWLRDPFAHNSLLGRFTAESSAVDLVVVNGDYSCDTAFVGVSDAASYASAEACLAALRESFAGRLEATIGDHELGKTSLFGGRGGLRAASYERCVDGLGLQPFWVRRVGAYTLIGMTSTLLALPVYEPEMPGQERDSWRRWRREHVEAVRAGFASRGSEERLLLFLHDPSALPFLAEIPEVRSRLNQLEATIIGHLHSPSVLRVSRLLAGLPPIRFLGHGVRRMSEGLSRARSWKAFRVQLCPSLAGIELLKDGGYLELELGSGSGFDPRVIRHRLCWPGKRRGVDRASG